LRQEEQGVELTGVPDHTLTSDQREQRDQHDLQVGPLTEGLGQRCLGGLALFLHLLEGRRFLHAHADPHADGQQSDRHDERHAPAPVSKGLFANRGTGAQDDQQRQEQTQRGCGLNPGGVGAAAAVRGMLGHIRGGTAVLTTQRQALQQTQDDQDDRGGHTDGVVVGQDAHDEGGDPHQQDGDQEGVLAADHVAKATENQSTEGANNEARSESQQRKNECRCWIQAREELFGDDGRQRAVEVKVIPFENRAQAGSENDFPLLGRHRRIFDLGACHMGAPCHYRDEPAFGKLDPEFRGLWAPCE